MENTLKQYNDHEQKSQLSNTPQPSVPAPPFPFPPLEWSSIRDPSRAREGNANREPLVLQQVIIEPAVPARSEYLLEQINLDDIIAMCHHLFSRSEDDPNASVKASENVGMACFSSFSGPSAQFSPDVEPCLHMRCLSSPSSSSSSSDEDKNRLPQTIGEDPESDDDSDLCSQDHLWLREVNTTDHKTEITQTTPPDEERKEVSLQADDLDDDLPIIGQKSIRSSARDMMEFFQFDQKGDEQVLLGGYSDKQPSPSRSVPRGLVDASNQSDADQIKHDQVSPISLEIDVKQKRIELITKLKSISDSQELQRLLLLLVNGAFLSEKGSNEGGKMPLLNNLTQKPDGVVSFSLSELHREVNKIEPKSSYPSKDWNGQFQELIDQPDSFGKFRSLTQLAHDFVYAATSYAKIIISELRLPDECKTIRPCFLGGLAGGIKYVCHNIMFKFAVDIQIPPKNVSWIYGIERPCDEKAMKAAGNELRGLTQYFATHINSLHYPLQALIDFYGYRIIAVALLPVSTTSLIYGSMDGGLSVKNESKDFSLLMERAAQHLNLQSHFAGNLLNQQYLHSCGDMEGHVGRDGKLYLLDFGRVMPPEAPPDKNCDLRRIFIHPKRKWMGDTELQYLRRACEPYIQIDVDHQGHCFVLTPLSDQRGVLFKLLRPEFVKNSPTPLSPDACTNWGNSDPNAKKYNSNVVDATNRLLFEVIREFASQVDEDRTKYQDSEALITEMHRLGINVRHLGQVRAYCKSPHAKKMILLEMVVRVIKDHINQKMRETVQIERGLSQEPFIEVVVDTFNLILGSHVYSSGTLSGSTDFPASPHHHSGSATSSSLFSLVSSSGSLIVSPRAQQTVKEPTLFSPVTPSKRNEMQQPQRIKFLLFWELIKVKLIGKFWNHLTCACGLSIQELHGFPEEKLHSSVRMDLLFKRLCKTTHIKISPAIKLDENIRSLEFVISDIESIEARPRFMDIIEYSEGMSLFLLAGEKGKAEKQRLLRIAQRKFESSWKKTTFNFKTLLYWARTDFALLSCLDAKDTEKPYYTWHPRDSEEQNQLGKQAASIDNSCVSNSSDCRTADDHCRAVKQRLLESAIEKLTRCISINPNCREAQELLASCYLQLADISSEEEKINFEKAAANFALLLSVEQDRHIYLPQLQKTILDLVQSHFRFEKLDGIRLLCKKLIEFSSKGSDSAVNLILYLMIVVKITDLDELCDKIEIIKTICLRDFSNVLHSVPICDQFLWHVLRRLTDELAQKSLRSPMFSIPHSVVRSFLSKMQPSEPSSNEKAAIESFLFCSSLSGTRTIHLDPIVKQAVGHLKNCSIQSDSIGERLKNTVIKSEKFDLFLWLLIPFHSSILGNKLKTSVFPLLQKMDLSFSTLTRDPLLHLGQVRFEKLQKLRIRSVSSVSSVIYALFDLTSSVSSTKNSSIKPVNKKRFYQAAVAPTHNRMVQSKKLMDSSFFRKAILILEDFFSHRLLNNTSKEKIQHLLEKEGEKHEKTDSLSRLSSTSSSLVGKELYFPNDRTIFWAEPQNPVRKMVPQLTEIDLSMSKGLSDAALSFLIGCCPSLKHLNVSFTESLTGLFSYISNLPLESLDISGLTFSSQQDEAFELFCTTNRLSLQRLEIFESKMTPSMMLQLHLLQQLEELNIGRSYMILSKDLPKEEIDKLFSSTRRLRKIRISKAFRELEYSLLRIAESELPIRKLDASQSTLSIQAVQAIAQILQNAHLSTLTREGVCGPVFRLNLASIHSSSRRSGDFFLFKLINQHPQSLASLCGINLSNIPKIPNEFFMRAFPLMTNLQKFCFLNATIDASLNDAALLKLIPEDGVCASKLRRFEVSNLTAISTAFPLFFRRTIHLKIVTVKNSPAFDGESIQVLTDHCPLLEKLDFSGCKLISEDSVVRLIERLHGRLKAIRLAGCPEIKNRTLETIVKHCPQLELIDLSKNSSICNRCFMSLGSLRYLEKIFLDGCGRLQDTAILSISLFCKKLRVLHLNDSHLITSLGISSLAKFCTSLELLFVQRAAKITVADFRLITSNFINTQIISEEVKEAEMVNELNDNPLFRKRKGESLFFPTLVSSVPAKMQPIHSQLL